MFAHQIPFSDYIEPQVPYIPMRLMGALMGVAVVPIAFYTVRNSGHSYHASVLAALLVLFGIIYALFFLSSFLFFYMSLHTNCDISFR